MCTVSEEMAMALALDAHVPHCLVFPQHQLCVCGTMLLLLLQTQSWFWQMLNFCILVQISVFIRSDARQQDSMTLPLFWESLSAELASDETVTKGALAAGS